MTSSEVDDAPATSSRPVSLGAVVGTVAAALLALVGVVFASRLVDVVGLLLGAIVIAVTTLPIQRRLARTIGGGASLAVTAVATTLVPLATAYLVLGDLADRTDELAELTQRRLDELRPGSVLDRVATTTRLGDTIGQWLNGVPSQIVVGGEGGGAIATQVFLFVTVVILATFLQSSGGAVVDWCCRRWERDTEPGSDGPSPRETAHLLAADLERRAFGWLRRVLALSTAAGASVAVVGALVDLPGAIALGVWVGIWAVVPVVGPAAAIAPLVVLVALDQRPVTAVVVAVVLAVLVIARLLRRRFADPLVHVGAAPYAIAVAAGVAIAGVGGSLVALAIVVTLLTFDGSPHRLPTVRLWTPPPGRTFQVNGVTLPTGWRLVLLVAAAAAAVAISWTLLLELGRFALWLLIGGFIAVALHRPTAWLTRRTRIPHVIAGAIVCVLIASAIGAAAMTGADDGASATTTLTERLPEITADFEELPIVGGWLAERDAAVWVEDQMNDLPQRVRTGRPTDWLPYLGDRLVDLFWCIVLAVALLIDGPRALSGLHRWVPARHRRQWLRLLGAAGTALGGYAVGAAIVASINASVIFVVAVLLGLGVAPALALWGFVWNFVPQIGGFMGGLPLVVFAFVLGPVQGLFAAVVFILYQFIENNLIQPAVIGATIDIAPWGALLAALAGGAAAGVAGAVVVTPLVGVIVVIRRELARTDFPGVTAGGTRDEPPALVR